MGQKLNLETQISIIEQSAIAKVISDAIRAGHQALETNRRKQDNRESRYTYQVETGLHLYVGATITSHQFDSRARMSFLFGTKKKQAPAPDLNTTIAKMRDALGNLEKREQYIAKQQKALMESAKKKNAAGNKKGALIELKRKKLLDKELDNMMGQKLNLETQISTLEQTSTTKDVFEAMQTGHIALKANQQVMNADKVAEVMDDTAEVMQDQDEVTKTLARPMGEDDTEELEQQLDQLSEEQVTDQLSQVEKPVNKLPVAQKQKSPVKSPAKQVVTQKVSAKPAPAPARSPTKKEDVEDKELAELLS